MEEPTPTSPSPEQQEEELTSDYANNTYFEPTVWDLKILFGEWSGRANSVDWHTSITLPWAQAKLLAYYLGINLAAREMREGRIKIPDTVIPPEIPPPTPETLQTNPESQAFFEMVQEHRRKFLETI
jgi:hypothetical protein